MMPFPLLIFLDLKRYAKLILETTAIVFFVMHHMNVKIERFKIFVECCKLRICIYNVLCTYIHLFFHLGNYYMHAVKFIFYPCHANKNQKNLLLFFIFYFFRIFRENLFFRHYVYIIHSLRCKKLIIVLYFPFVVGTIPSCSLKIKSRYFLNRPRMLVTLWRV